LSLTQNAKKPQHLYRPRAALLGFFFGAHNFYAGYKRKAVMQLCLTAFTFWFSLES